MPDTQTQFGLLFALLALVSLPLLRSALDERSGVQGWMGAGGTAMAAVVHAMLWKPEAVSFVWLFGPLPASLWLLASTMIFAGLHGAWNRRSEQLAGVLWALLACVLNLWGAALFLWIATVSGGGV